MLYFSSDILLCELCNTQHCFLYSRKSQCKEPKLFENIDQLYPFQLWLAQFLSCPVEIPLVRALEEGSSQEANQFGRMGESDRSFSHPQTYQEFLYVEFIQISRDPRGWAIHEDCQFCQGSKLPLIQALKFCALSEKDGFV